MNRCKEVLTAIHPIVHDTLEKEYVCIESGHISLPNTEPETSLVIIIAAVQTEHFEKIRAIGHAAITNAMEEIYGAANETRKQ